LLYTALASTPITCPSTDDDVASVISLAALEICAFRSAQTDGKSRN
jgi:hypothetical protein